MRAFPGHSRADHSQFRGFDVGLAFGRRQGKFVHISDAARGLACDCVCPACGDPLVAKKGPTTAHHFAHDGAGGGCGYAAETSAHIWAKAVLMQVKMIWLPPIKARVDGKLVVLREKERFNFDHVTSERKLGGIVPDIVLTAGTRRLIVEVFVTHRCDDEKIRKIRDLDLSAIEVDLSRFRSATGRDEKENQKVRRELLWAAPRAWLYNSRLPRLVDKYRSAAEAQSSATSEPPLMPATAAPASAQLAPSFLAALPNPATPPPASPTNTAPPPPENARHVRDLLEERMSAPPYLPRWLRPAWMWIKRIPGL